MSHGLGINILVTQFILVFVDALVRPAKTLFSEAAYTKSDTTRRDSTTAHAVETRTRIPYAVP
jgi:hypothetical protein